MKLVTPFHFWLVVSGVVYLGARFGRAYLSFLLLALIFLAPTQIGTPKLFKGDPLDKIMYVLTMFFCTMAAISFFANMHMGLFVLCTVLYFAAYVGAPSRKHPNAVDQCRKDRVNGKNFMVTGCTSGIGVETVRALYLSGANRVFMVARNPKKLKATIDQIVRSSTAMHGEEKLVPLVCDLNDLGSVKACANDFQSKFVDTKAIVGLHCLITNAGVMALAERRDSAQGFERQVGINHIGHYLLARLVQPALARVPGSRLVALSSSAHRMCDIKFLDHDRLETVPYDPWVAYGNSKYANILFAKAWNKRFGGPDGTCAFAVMPGGIFTGLQDEVPKAILFKWLVVAPFFFKTVSQGAATSLHCATIASIDDSGSYFNDCKVGAGSGRFHKKSEDVDLNARRLWEKTEKLVSKWL